MRRRQTIEAEQSRHNDWAQSSEDGVCEIVGK
jgi:hypothetical protein